MIGPDTDCTCGASSLGIDTCPIHATMKSPIHALACTCDVGRTKPSCPVHGAPAHNRAPPDDPLADPLADPPFTNRKPPMHTPRTGTASFIRSAAIQELNDCLNQITNLVAGEGEPVLYWGTEDRSIFTRGQIAELTARVLKIIAAEAKANFRKQTADTILKPVTVGSTWEHHSGHIYTVYDITNESTECGAKYPVTISYMGQDGKRWSGPLWDWYRRMTLLVFEPNE